MSSRIILVSLLTLLLSSCSLFSTQALSPTELVLLPPAEGPEPILLKHNVMMQSQGMEQQFIVVIRLNYQQVKLKALLPTGQTILTIEYDGKQFHNENYSPIEVPSKEILAMMQFSLWPIKTLHHHYRPELGWLVSDTNSERTLVTSSGTVLTTQFLDNDNVIVEHHLHDYRVIISPLDSNL
jgi:hypothetical protein